MIATHHLRENKWKSTPLFLSEWKLLIPLGSSFSHQISLFIELIYRHGHYLCYNLKQCILKFIFSFPNESSFKVQTSLHTIKWSKNSWNSSLTLPYQGSTYIHVRHYQIPLIWIKLFLLHFAPIRIGFIKNLKNDIL